MSKQKKFIVKVQRPLATSSTEDAPQALIYDEYRSFQHLVPYEMVQYLFPNNEDKVYVWAKVNNKGLQIIEAAKPQSW